MLTLSDLIWTGRRWEVRTAEEFVGLDELLDGRTDSVHAAVGCYCRSADTISTIGNLTAIGAIERLAVARSNLTDIAATANAGKENDYGLRP